MPDTPADPELIAAARAAAGHAFAPASGFRVGAAVRTADGAIVPGCNVESASYGLTLCAERNAVARAVCDGATRIVAVAVWTGGARPSSPCGACRQVLAEFASPDCPVFLAGPDADPEVRTVGELLPRPFTFADLASDPR